MQSYRNFSKKRRFALCQTPRRPAGKPPTACRIRGRPKSRKTCFPALCDEWLCFIRGSIKESTYGTYAAITEKHIKPLSAAAPPGTAEICRYVQRLREENFSAHRCKDILAVLKMILRYIGGQTGIPVAASFPTPREEKRPPRVLSPDEQEALLSALKSEAEPYKRGILLSLYTGLRIGEVCALRRQNVSFAEGTLRVDATVQRVHDAGTKDGRATKVLFGSPKSETSRRTVPLIGKALELLKPCEPFPPDVFLLTGTGERWIEPRTLQYRLRKVTERAGLDGVHFHTLRHTFATRCVENGVEIKSLSEIMGHSSPKITLEKYVHSSPELKSNELRKIERAF